MGYTPDRVMGELVRIGRSRGGASLPSLSLAVEGAGGAESRHLPSDKTRIEALAGLVANLQVHLARMGPPRENPFHPTRLVPAFPSYRQTIGAHLQLPPPAPNPLPTKFTHIANT